jgi:hypothetical protein
VVRTIQIRRPEFFPNFVSLSVSTYLYNWFVLIFHLLWFYILLVLFWLYDSVLTIGIYLYHVQCIYNLDTRPWYTYIPGCIVNKQQFVQQWSSTFIWFFNMLSKSVLQCIKCVG